jgi:O-antigen/teichoic acid export membrane protein
MKQLKKILQHQQFRKLLIYGFGQLFNLVTPLLVVPYIVGICGEENFGKVGVGLAVSFFLIVFIDYGSDLVGVREVSVHRNDPKMLGAIVMKSYASRLVVLVGVLIAASVIFNLVPYFKDEKALFFLSMSILLGQFLNPTWFLQGMENVRWITLSNILSKSIYLAGVFFLIRQPGQYIYVNLLWGAGMILSNALFLGLIFRTYNFTFQKIKLSEIKDFLMRDFSMLGSQVFVSLQLNSPVILLSYFGSDLMAGQYKIVEQIIVIFKTYIFLFFNYVFPKVCYLLEVQPKRALRNWVIYNGANLIFVASGMAVFYIFAYDIVAYFNTTNRYLLSSLLHVAVLLPLAMAVSIPMKQLLLGWNQKRFYVRLTSLLILCNLGAIIILIPYYQVYGVFYALLACEILMALVYLLYLRKRIAAVL